MTPIRGVARQDREVPPQKTRIRLLVLDHHPVVRAGVRAVMEALAADIEVAGEGVAADEVVALFRACRADVVLLDLHLRDGSSGVDAIRMLRRHEPSSRVVVLTDDDGEEHVYGAISAGACGYVLKDAEPAQIVDAVRSAHAGRRYLSAEASFRLADHAYSAPLTAREHEVLALLARGDKNRRIATRLGVTEQTVKTHVKNILSKLGASSRTEAARKAVLRGIVRAD